MSKSIKEIDDLLADILDPVEERDDTVQIRMDLAPCAGTNITHCGRPYYHNSLYTVAKGVAADLHEIMRRGHSHEASIKKPDTVGRRRMGYDASQADSVQQRFNRAY